MFEQQKQASKASNNQQKTEKVSRGGGFGWVKKTSFGVLAVAILVSLGLWGYKINLEKEKGSILEEINSLQEQRDRDLEEKILSLAEETNFLKRILRDHVYSVRMLEAMEDVLLLKARLSKVDINVIENRATVVLEAENYNTFAQQIEAFKLDDKIKEVDFSGISLQKSGDVASGLKIRFDPDFYKGSY